MSSNPERAAILERALRAGIEGDHQTIGTLLTEDVRAWTPAFATVSLAELAAQFDRRDEAFSEVALAVEVLDVGGDFACAEWTVTMRHTGVLVLADGKTLDPTDRLVVFHGVTIAEFFGDQICSLRQYWDELAVFEQLGLVHADPT